MKRVLLSLVPALFSCLVLAAPGQDEQDPERIPDRELYPWTDIGDKEHRRLLRDLQGAWRLTTLIDPQLPEGGRRETGYALVSDRWMSIEIHVGVDVPGGERPLGMIRTGTYRIALGPANRMELSSLIGSFLDRYGELRAEPPNTLREFDVTVSSNLFTLQRADGYEISFARLEDSQPRRDIFGRPR